MQYIDIVNKVIRESGSEIDELTSLTWASAVAGRRLYPRIKQYVADAWRALQVKRDQWEFRATEVSTVVYPRLKFSNLAGGDPLGVEFTGDDSGFTFTVASLPVDNTTSGQFEFSVYDNDTPLPIPGETFRDALNTITFIYEGRGSYDFGLTFTDLHEIDWTTMAATYDGMSPINLIYVPYDNYIQRHYYYSAGFMTPPAYVSQDPQGNVVFYSQTLLPFRLFFWYTQQPLELVDYDDTPEGLPSPYHTLLAWEALAMLATYDKNPDLFAHAELHAKPYRKAVEKNLMPPMQWAGSLYDE